VAGRDRSSLTSFFCPWFLRRDSTNLTAKISSFSLSFLAFFRFSYRVVASLCRWRVLRFLHLPPPPAEANPPFSKRTFFPTPFLFSPPVVMHRGGIVLCPPPSLPSRIVRVVLTPFWVISLLRRACGQSFRVDEITSAFLLFYTLQPE